MTAPAHFRLAVQLGKQLRLQTPCAAANDCLLQLLKAACPVQAYVSHRQHKSEQLQGALEHRRLASLATAQAAWKQGLVVQRSQHARLQAVAARWSQRSVAGCWDTWRQSVAHTQDLRSRLGVALGALESYG